MPTRADRNREYVARSLVKAWLLSIQFAKDQNLLPQFVQKDIEVMSPVNKRMGQLIAATGEKEIALEAVAGWSPCHHHLYVGGTEKLPGARRFKSPFATVWLRRRVMKGAGSVGT